ncbi:MAG: histidine phosphatase family protein [Alphaproteobacteria bacterium]
MPLPQKSFYMIRHGQTEANVAQVMAGSTDSPLTQTGRDQARSVQNIVKALSIKPTAIVHSNLSRARDTAGIINEVLNIPMHEDADLAEIHSGDWEGKPWVECEDLLDGWPTPPGGETFDEFCARLKRGKHHHLNLHDGPILIVSHGGVFRGMGGIYGLNTPGVFENCHLHEFHPDASNTHFPWKVWSYRYSTALERTKTDVFHESKRHYEAPKIA